MTKIKPMIPDLSMTPLNIQDVIYVALIQNRTKYVCQVLCGDGWAESQVQSQTTPGVTSDSALIRSRLLTTGELRDDFWTASTQLNNIIRQICGLVVQNPSVL